VALALGAVAALMLVAGHHPWDGPVVTQGFGGHGLHRGDVLAVVPAMVAPALAWWCWRRRERPARATRSHESQVAGTGRVVGP
jgi:hypothetical protein